MCESHEITANAGAKPSYDMYTTVQVMQRREMTHTLVTTKLQDIYTKLSPVKEEK